MSIDRVYEYETGMKLNCGHQNCGGRSEALDVSVLNYRTMRVIMTYDKKPNQILPLLRSNRGIEVKQAAYGRGGYK